MKQIYSLPLMAALLFSLAIPCQLQAMEAPETAPKQEELDTFSDPMIEKLNKLYTTPNDEQPKKEPSEESNDLPDTSSYDDAQSDISDNEDNDLTQKNPRLEEIRKEAVVRKHEREAQQKQEAQREREQTKQRIKQETRQRLEQEFELRNQQDLENLNKEVNAIKKQQLVQDLQVQFDKEKKEKEEKTKENRALKRQQKANERKKEDAANEARKKAHEEKLNNIQLQVDDKLQESEKTQELEEKTQQIIPEKPREDKNLSKTLSRQKKQRSAKNPQRTLPRKAQSKLPDELLPNELLEEYNKIDQEAADQQEEIRRQRAEEEQRKLEAERIRREEQEKIGKKNKLNTPNVPGARFTPGRLLVGSAAITTIAGAGYRIATYLTTAEQIQTVRGLAHIKKFAKYSQALPKSSKKRAITDAMIRCLIANMTLLTKEQKETLRTHISKQNYGALIAACRDCKEAVAQRTTKSKRSPGHSAQLISMGLVNDFHATVLAAYNALGCSRS